MDSHESGYFPPSASSTASAPSTFRLLKSMIFSSASSKPKHSQSPKIPTLPSTAPHRVYLFPGQTSTSDQIDHLSQDFNPEQNISLTRRRSKSNNMINRYKESEARSNLLSSPPATIASRSKPSVDLPRSKPSFELLRTGLSIDLSRSAPSIDLQRCAPTQSNLHHLPQNNRIVVDLNSNRLNYPSFNNKPAAQNGPRVLRLVGALSNPQSENHSSHVGYSHRPTPIPHGGSGAILTINTPNSTRSAGLPPTWRHPDTASSLTDPAPPSSRSEPLTMNIQPLGSSVPTSQDHHNVVPAPPLETLDIIPSGKSTFLLRSHHSFSELGFRSDKERLSCDLSQKVPPDFTSLLSSSTSTTTKNLDASISTLASSTAVPSKQGTFQCSSDAIPASKQSFEVDFSEFANFLSYPESAPSKSHTQLFLSPNISQSSPTRPSSLASNLSSKPSSTPKSYLTPNALSSSNERASSSLPSTPVPFKSAPASSPSSLRAFDPLQLSNAALAPLPSLALASPPSTVQPPSSSPQSTASPPYSAGLSPSSPRRNEALKAGIHSATSSGPSSPPPPSSGSHSISSQNVHLPHPSVPLPQPRVPLPQPPQNFQSQLELEHARKIILGLQNEVKQLKDASSESSNPAHKLSTTSDESVLSSSPNHKLTPKPSHCTEKSELELLDDDSLSLTIVQAGLSQKPNRPLVEAALTENCLPKAHSAGEIPKSDSNSQSGHELEYNGKPSRLPIAKHRLRDLPLEFARNLHSRTPSGASTLSRSLKVSVDSNGSTEYRCATSHSHSTYRTTPSPISTTLGPQPRKGASARSRNTRDTIHSNSRTPERSTNQDLRRQDGRSFLHSRAPSIVSHSSSSSSQLARPRAGITRSRRHNGSMPSIHDDHSFRSESVLDFVPEHSRHYSRRHVNRSGLSSVEEGVVLTEQADESARNMMTKVELLAMLKNQQAEFAIEREELLDALRRSRDKVAQTSLEWERLRAEDGWKTEQLNKAREEISWLSRLADALELDKSKLEKRVNSLANELKGRLGDNKKATTPTSQSSVMMQNVGPMSPSRGTNLTQSTGSFSSSVRSGDSVSPSRSTFKSFYSPKTPSTATYRARHLSGDSVRTICPNVPGSKVNESQSHSSISHTITKWRARESPVKESDPVTPGTRQLSAKQRFALAQRSVSDFRVPSTLSSFHSPRSEDAESLSSRQRGFRPPSTSRSIVLRQIHPEYQYSEGGSSEDGRRADTIIEERDDQVCRGDRSEHAGSFRSRQRGFRPPSTSRSIALRQIHPEYQHSEGGSSEDGRRADTIIEERDDQVHRGDTPSEHSNSRGFHHPDYAEDEQEPLDYQDVAYELDAHNGHSRRNSGESLAISPSSTVFADHQRNARSRISMYNRHSRSLHEHSDSRNSLISLQLRPEDELFLENYLEDDGIPSDDEF